MFALIGSIPTLAVEDGRRDRFGGSGFLGGTAPASPDGPDGRARILNVPARIDITVMEPVTHEVVARTWSSPDGTWRVPYLNVDLQFTVIGTDRGQQVNSAIQDWIRPAPMGE